MKKISLLLVLLIFSCSKDSLEDEINITGNSEIESEIILLINSHRKSIGKSTLVENTIAQKYAAVHTIYMIKKGKLSHDNFPDRANSISEKTDASYIAENVARKYITASEAVTNWLGSDEHKKNIEGDYTHTGISVIKNTEGDFYFTQLFYK